MLDDVHLGHYLGYGAVGAAYGLVGYGYARYIDAWIRISLSAYSTVRAPDPFSFHLHHGSALVATLVPYVPFIPTLPANLTFFLEVQGSQLFLDDLFEHQTMWFGHRWFPMLASYLYKSKRNIWPFKEPEGD